MAGSTLRFLTAKTIFLGAALGMSSGAFAESFLGDFDGDGQRKDLLVQNELTGALAIVLNYDSYTRREVAYKRTWKASWELHPADFDGDGADDVFAVDFETGRVKMTLNEVGYGTGSYSSESNTSAAALRLPDWDDLGLTSAKATGSVDLVEVWDSTSTVQFGLQHIYVAGAFHPTELAAQIVQYDPGTGVLKIRRDADLSVSNHLVTEQQLTNGFGLRVKDAELSVVHRTTTDLLRVETFGGEHLYYEMTTLGRFTLVKNPVLPGCDDFYGCDGVDLDPLCNPLVEECDEVGGGRDPLCNPTVEECDEIHRDDIFRTSTRMSLGDGDVASSLEAALPTDHELPACAVGSGASQWWLCSALLSLFVVLAARRKA